MGDLLLRGLDDALKVELQNSARCNGRSLSDEAIAAIRLALVMRQNDGQFAGERLRGLLGEIKFEDKELEAIESFRKHKDRGPPDLTGL